MKSIDQKLVKNKYHQRRKEYLDAELAKITERIQHESETLERLKRELDKENEDVARLQQVSLTRLLKTFNSREELRLEKEKAEAFRAALDYKLKQNELEDLHYQKNLLEQELKQYDNVHSDYQSLLELKRKMLETAVLNQIRDLEQELAQCLAQKETLKKAWDSAKRLCSSLTYFTDILSDLAVDRSEALKVWKIMKDQGKNEEAMDELAQLSGLLKNFEQDIATAKMTLPEEFACDFLDKLRVEDMNAEQFNIIKMNLTFDQFNTYYSGVRTVLNQLEKQLSEVEHRQFDLQWQIQESIEIN